MRKLIVLLCGLLLVSMAFANMTEDRGPIAEPITYPPMDDPWDILAWFDAQVITGDDQLLGCEYAGDMFWLSGGGGTSGLVPNTVYALNSDGTFNFSFEQWSSAGWGWRDLAYDGSYLYGSDDYVVDAWDLTGTAAPAMNINGPISPCRALAYDPLTDSFWTQSFGGPCNNFDRAGGVIWSGASGVTAAYGMMWDELTDMLWIYDQTGNPSTTIHEFDPVAHTLTGFSYNIPLIGPSSDQIAGGCGYTQEYSTVSVMVGVTQGTPNDLLFVMEMPLSPTPVVLTAFNANVVDNGVLLTWNTASEIECHSWTVERNGVEVATLPGAGTTEEPQSYSYLDEVGNGTYTYQLKQTDVSGASSYSDEITVTVAVANVYDLAQNFPNPFNPSTSISYSLANGDFVNLTVYDVTGSEVATLVNGYRDAGSYDVSFDAAGLTSGIYFYKLTAGDFTSIHKMVLMK
jgi:hypothetical protein